MLVNHRIKEIRLYRRFEGKELAKRAGLTPGAISHLEKKIRTPRIDTLQKIGPALDVTTNFLLGEEDAGLPLPRALARQSLKIFLRDNEVTPQEQAYLQRVCELDSAPDTVKGWRDLLTNLAQWGLGPESFAIKLG
jgi:transcriptional regulator with XRE-family HTH domain